MLDLGERIPVHSFVLHKGLSSMPRLHDSTPGILAPLAVLASLLVAPLDLAAQLEVGNGSNFGSAALSPGFAPDPHRIAIVSGGSMDVREMNLGENCVGFATRRPDYTVDLEEPTDRLRFYVEGDGDTGLIIAGPGKRFHCDDDSRGLNPMVVFEDARAGRYDVWVSSYASGENIASTLHITELADASGAGSSGSLAVGGTSSNFGRTSLNAGFTPDPFDVRVTSGGSLRVSGMELGAGCVGFATRTPDYILDYSAGSSMLRFFVEGEGDTALIINAPDGSWHCGDDSFGTFDPTVTFDAPRSGQYDIWVASYSEGSNVSGRLKVTELSSERPQN
mgnify:CR=1 FL=1